jgi:PAS domain S-box-containing protein
MHETSTEQGLPRAAAVVLVAVALVCGVLLAIGPGDYPSLHTILDTSLALLLGVVALLLWDMGQHAGSSFLKWLGITFAATCVLAIIHVLVTVEWSGPLAMIARLRSFLRPATWPPATHLLPIGVGWALWRMWRGVTGRTFSYAVGIIVLGAGLFTAFQQLPTYLPPGPLGITRPALVLAPLLWAGVGVAAWRLRALNRLAQALVWTAGTLCLANTVMLCSRAPADGPAMAAHLGRVGGFLVLLLSAMQMASRDLRERIRAESALASLNEDLDRRVAVQTAALQEGEAKFRSVVENMSEGLMIFDPQGKVLFHNPASARMHAIELEEVGLLRRDELPVKWRVCDKDGVRLPFDSWPIGRVLRGERFQEQHLQVERVDTGATFDAVCNGSPIYSAGGDFILGFITLRDVQDDIHAQRELARANDLLRGFTDAVPGLIYAKDRDSRMLFANNGTAELIGRDRSEFIGKTDAEFLDDKAQGEAVMANDRHVMSTGVSEQVEEHVSFANGTAATWLSTKAPLRDREGRITGVIGLSVDISARKATEAELQLLNDRLENQAAELTAANGRLNEALTHRELLVREVYHRVKNNMQMVDSILVMQEGHLADPEAKNALTSLRGRVYALGLVHHQLMGSANLRTFDVAPFLRELTTNIMDGGASRGVSVRVSADPLDVGLDFAIPLGLLVTELVTNSLKHAFPSGEGHIDVLLSRNPDGSFALVVSDNGTGYDCDDSSQSAGAGGLGSKIIRALVSQLKATMKIQSDHGTRAEIHIGAPA